MPYVASDLPFLDPAALLWLAEKTCVVVLLALGASRAPGVRRLFAVDSLAWHRQLLIGAALGLLAADGAFTVLQFDSARVDIRDAGPIVAGLFGGPISGLLAGLIGAGCQLAVGPGTLAVGGDLAIAAPIGSVALGLLAGVVRQRWGPVAPLPATGLAAFAVVGNGLVHQLLGGDAARLASLGGQQLAWSIVGGGPGLLDALANAGAVGAFLAVFYRDRLATTARERQDAEFHDLKMSHDEWLRSAEDLRESQRQISTLIDNLPGVVYRRTPGADWTMKYVSDAIITLVGYSPAHLIDNAVLSYQSLVVPADRSRVEETIAAAIGQGKPYVVEYRVQARSGREKWVWERGRGDFDESGRLLALEGIIIDVTDRRRAEEALQESERQYRALYESQADPILVVDQQTGKIVDINSAACRVYGYSRQEFLQLFSANILAEPGNSRDLARLDTAIIPTRYDRRKDDTVFPVELKASEVTLKGRKALIVSVREIGERLRTERELRQREARYRGLFRGVPAGVVVLDATGAVVDANDRALSLFETTAEQLHSGSPFDGARLAAKSLDALRSGRPLENATIGITTTSGQPRWLLANSVPIVDPGNGGALGMIASFIDITERKRQEQTLAYLAAHDQLTGLPNHRMLKEALQRSFVNSLQGIESTLLFLDLDNFKLINDTLGHAAGDQALVNVTHLFRTGLRDGDLLVRVGGDEFAVLLDNTGPDQAMDIAERLRRAVDEHRMVLEGQSFKLGVSIGLALVDGQQKPEVVLSQADAAMYRAKSSGRNRVVVDQRGSNPLVDLADANRLAIRIRDAFAQDRFFLHFQPIVRLQDGRVEYHEALIRMRDESDNIVLPGGFIQAAERFGLMPQLTQFTIDQAIQSLRADEDLKVFVNLSGHCLMDEGLLEWIEARLRQAGSARERIGFEITETAMVQDLAVAERWIRRLKEPGCCFALDDFGAGFSSFNYLRHLPIDVIKIDGAIVRNAVEDAQMHAMVEAIHTIAQAMGKQVVGEFVESGAIAQALADIGITYGQGFHLGRPGVLPLARAPRRHPVASLSDAIGRPFEV